jgi:S-adenosyl-L-methionine hydrolase (adenosine-forming)
MGDGTVAFFFGRRSIMKQEGRVVARRKTRSKHRPVALLTDFGDSDHYAGTLKGVIVSINPDVRMIDISHNVSPQNIREAAYLLWASYRYFPERTIFVCVVDPGVGTQRKIISVDTDRHTFIAPDNGLLDFVLCQENVRRSYEILRPPQFGSNPISATFHGRDIFAPIAALCSLGKSVTRFGRRCELKKPSSPFYEPEKGGASARILHIDYFGNLITNIPKRHFAHCTINVKKNRVLTRIHTYAEAPQNRPCIIVGSSGLIEIILKEGSAAKMLGADLQTPITVLKDARSQES